MKKAHTLFLLLFFAVFVYSSDALAQTRCFKCHGSGRMQTRYKTSTYGMNSKKIQCQHCKQWILDSEEHFDRCTNCNGSGYATSARQQARNQQYNESSSEWMSYLTPEEVSVVMNLFDSLKPQIEHVNCSVCNGTGKCKICGGVQVFSLDATGYCWVCQGVGHCLTCNGRGVNGVRSVEPQNKEQILKYIQSYVELANKRRNGQW